MANILYYPNLNPIKFYLPSPDTTYESRDIDDFEFFDSIAEWEEHVDYYQPWNKTDQTKLQLMADFGPHNLVIKDLDGITITTIPFNQIAQSQDQPGLYIYECPIDFNLLDVGQYRLYHEAGLDDKLIVRSRIQDICTRHKHSLLLEYYHFQYHEGVVFETGFKPKFRVEGANKFKSPASIGEDFEDQTLDESLLSAIPYRVYELIIGDAKGVPPDVIDLVNMIFTCTTVNIDGKGFVKPIENKWEVNEQDGYPAKGWKTELRPAVNRTSRIYNNNDPQNSKVSIVINADSKGFGLDTGGTNTQVLDVQ
jgi:hypothetical protein